MFSGIVETTGAVQSVRGTSSLQRISVQRPLGFNDLKVGDSIACDGVCLTLEAFDSKTMEFALAAETLKITRWSSDNLKDRSLNLERSLRLQDRIHGHLISGHVDGMGQVIAVENRQESKIVKIQVPQSLKKYVWKKGSIAVNGVSLTVNEISDEAVLEVCLIPETLKRTNLQRLGSQDFVTLEIDAQARGLVSFLESSGGRL